MLLGVNNDYLNEFIDSGVYTTRDKEEHDINVALYAHTLYNSIPRDKLGNFKDMRLYQGACALAHEHFGEELNNKERALADYYLNWQRNKKEAAEAVMIDHYNPADAVWTELETEEYEDDNFDSDF